MSRCGWRALAAILAGLLWPGWVHAQAVDVAKVTSRTLERVIVIPGELQPYQSVVLHARVVGFVEAVDVDRGSAVKKGQRLVKLAAPEVTAQMAEAESKLRGAEAQRAEAEAKAKTTAGVAAKEGH